METPFQTDTTWLHSAARDLNWQEVLVNISAFAVNEQTVAALLERMPLAAREEAACEHAWVAEALALERAQCRLPIRRTGDLKDPLGALKRGADVSGSGLRQCVDCIEQSTLLFKHVSAQRELCPSLHQALVVDPELAPLARTLRAAIDDSGQLYDGASDGLRSARQQLAHSRDALRSEQTQLLRIYRDKLAGAYFAEREGRYVLPVRADAGRIEGTVLGSSATGNTLYVEPQSLIEKNNRVRIAEALVHQEETKILHELSMLAATHLGALERTAQQCLLADRIAAVATWAHRHQALPVTFAAEPVLELRQMRHPLLLSDDADSSPVANDLELNPAQALIISGPNAGGKTVALKCLGLAAWLARSGLPVPCAPQSKIGWFENVITDIGDDQSISRSLSTFSAHVQKLAHCVRRARRGTLLLLDEVAGGTDPEEGAALAVATLEALVAAGASVAVTTHYERLKQLGASGKESFRNASVGFDLERMSPTFRIHLGTPGASSALAVAQRFGLPEAVVTRARACLPKEQRDQQRLIEQLEQEREQVAQLLRDQQELLDEATRQRDASEREREHLLRQSRSELERLSAELTREVQQARTELRQAKALLRSPSREAWREAEQLVNAAAAPITLHGSLTRVLRQAPSQPAAPTSQELTVGTVVRLLHLNTEASVVEAPNKGQVRVAVGGLKMSVPLDQVRAQPMRQSVKKNPSLRRNSPGLATREAAAPRDAEPIRSSLNTCDLRGLRVDEGLARVDAFLDRMLQLRETAAFVLHGHGTGAMKSAVREHLAASPVVRQFEAATREDGGDAVTVVHLR